MTLAEMDQRVAEWVASEKGQRELAETAKRARDAAERVRADARVTPEQMREPVTI